MRTNFPPIVQRNYPRDMEAPDYVALCGEAARRNRGNTQSGIWTVMHDDEWVSIRSIAIQVKLPLAVVNDIAIRNGLKISTPDCRKIRCVEDGDRLEDILISAGPPAGTNTMANILNLGYQAQSICKKLAKDLSIAPVYIAGEVEYYSPEQVHTIRGYYDKMMRSKYKETAEKMRELRKKKKEEGTFVAHPNSPWERQRNKNSTRAPEGYMTQRDVCDRIHVKYKDLQARMKSGFLRYTIIDGKKYIQKEDVEKYETFRRNRADSKTDIALEG